MQSGDCSKLSPSLKTWTNLGHWEEEGRSNLSWVMIYDFWFTRLAKSWGTFWLVWLWYWATPPWLECFVGIENVVKGVRACPEEFREGFESFYLLKTLSYFLFDKVWINISLETSSLQVQVWRLEPVCPVIGREEWPKQSDLIYEKLLTRLLCRLYFADRNDADG